MSEAHPTRALLSISMANFLLGLFCNLTVLAIVMITCCIVNGLRPHAAVNGYCVFVILETLALAFDAALTFLVFADSQKRYGAFSMTSAFIERASAYSIACITALCFARLRVHRRKARAGDSVVINPSPYSDWRLRR